MGQISKLVFGLIMVIYKSKKYTRKIIPVKDLMWQYMKYKLGEKGPRTTIVDTTKPWEFYRYVNELYERLHFFLIW